METGPARSQLKQWIALYIAGISVLLVPVFIIKDGYLHLIETKAHCYLALVLPAAAAAVILMAISYKTEKQTLSPDRLFLLLIAFWSLLSTLLSQGIKSSSMWNCGSCWAKMWCRRIVSRCTFF